VIILVINTRRNLFIFKIVFWSCSTRQYLSLAEQGDQIMIRRLPRTIFDEIVDMRGYIDDISRSFLNEPTLPLLPEGETSALPMMYRGDLKIDVVEHNDNVTVTADIIPGVAKEGIFLELVYPQSLKTTTPTVNITHTPISTTTTMPTKTTSITKLTTPPSIPSKKA
jgi:HSP20 family molecular chaperone IbpA